MENTRQEKIIEMFKIFQKLSREDQVYASGIIKGMYLQKQSIKEEKQSA